MTVTLVGLGCGDLSTLTLGGREALAQADCLLGAPRLLEALPEEFCSQRVAATRPNEIMDCLHTGHYEHPCVVFSGDTGFYSGTRGLIARLKPEGMDYRVLPGISSIQMLSARLGRPWQDWKLCSAHGVQMDAVNAVMEGRPVFFLTGGQLCPKDLCRQLTDAGLGELTVTVAENLSYPFEAITEAKAAELVDRDFHPLAVMLAEPAPMPLPRRCSGFDDDLFLRAKVPMTKQEVRAAALGKLAITPTDRVWDVGAGTGSVSIELALAAHQGHCWAVECVEEACALIAENKQHFGAWNLSLISGKAPEALTELPAPDAVFIGGTRGGMDRIFDIILEKNPDARICVTAIAVESLAQAIDAFKSRKLEFEVSQVAASRTKKAGPYHLLMTNNPTFLVTRRFPAEVEA